MKPTSRSFEQAKALGDAGEAAVARALARQAEELLLLLGAPLSRMVVKLALGARAREEKVGGVLLCFAPTARASQRFGDVELIAADGTSKTLEVKTEQYALGRAGQDRQDQGRRATSSLAFETHDLVSPTAYRTLWTAGEPLRGGLLPYPSTGIPFARPTRPEWYAQEGGHLRTQADWLVHAFVCGALVVVSTARVRRALQRGTFDGARWFASCTREVESGALCRNPAGTGIRYYTVGKLLAVRALERAGQARRLTEASHGG